MAWLGRAWARFKGHYGAMHDDILAAFDISDRVAVVTGAASGIGRGTAVTLAKAGGFGGAGRRRR